jgi:hypothetical protein
MRNKGKIFDKSEEEEIMALVLSLSLSLSPILQSYCF